ncbi:hypothetical protein ACFHWD_05380 [Clostridium sp. MT-14]|jgi:hypothetical protein|uniref:Uncharacterized protein n=1 Tax=Clostridium aromativorans TaxID=2836848 RepID=A0ABS8N229_9CLOT|nr:MULTISPECIES: hypothetical protein [Clostridium]KAA8671987.1 hypothetical protein F3O63_10695 [Clostridium sp. HV4-5-A1G]MCC9293746.1 hypothetical protein [Clostridium aromativorans]CAB1254329.1 conserved hypothetical protein [Clostridiaceae bacterium BL-3]
MKDNVIKVDFSKNVKKKDMSFLSSAKLFLSKLFSSANKTPKETTTKDKDTKKIIYYSKDIS